MRGRRILGTWLAGAALLAGLCAAGPASERSFRQRLAQLGVTPLKPGPRPPAAKVALGQMLFFDRVLSGTRDTSCATCHHPQCFLGDEVALGVGVLGMGLGPERVKDPSRPFIPRNAPDVFHRGVPGWKVMFWDGRVRQDGPGRFTSPAKEQLPGGLDSVLAAQAMFPVTSRDEMRGLPGDPGNELALFADTDFRGVWSALMTRLLAIPGYRALFAAAYPGVPASRLDFRHAANALAAFETAAFTPVDSPWDRYLVGNDRALSAPARRGAALFYGKAGCYQCHSGPLMTDQSFHNLAVPQFGPGKPPAKPLDIGRMGVTSRDTDRFAFRTPPLRNVAVTGPWMHDGAYRDLRDAVAHHLDPVTGLYDYDPSQLPEALRGSLVRNPVVLSATVGYLDRRLRHPPAVREAELDDLTAFLEALTSPSLASLPYTIPAAVPSGLSVDRLP